MVKVVYSNSVLTLEGYVAVSKLFSMWNYYMMASHTDSRKCDNKLRKIYKENLTKKIREFVSENMFMTSLLTFAFIQAFTAH